PPSAREAAADRPWPRVRMAEVAGAAGVSRQALYNEFGTKGGLGAALVEHELDAFVERTVRAAGRAARDGGPVAGCAEAAVRTVRAARRQPLVRAALTGRWESRLPLPGEAPDRLAVRLRVRMTAALVPALAAAAGTDPATGGSGASGADPLRRACEVALRLALSYVVAPCGGPPETTEEAAGAHVAQVLRALIG
ncbi:TetR/AcrR family transcriptional regulator, partial [Streptomyces sp. URMC 125]|uniref:TetR/AcrR family transcriptional regulator n=1 Tax=Streptomyces sp. URMC 125 TaxID=3423419 RepID=UPI003F1A2BFE